jgi:hypothetical protein
MRMVLSGNAGQTMSTFRREAAESELLMSDEDDFEWKFRSGDVDFSEKRS